MRFTRRTLASRNGIESIQAVWCAALLTSCLACIHDEGAQRSSTVGKFDFEEKWNHRRHVRMRAKASFVRFTERAGDKRLLARTTHAGASRKHNIHAHRHAVGKIEKVKLKLNRVSSPKSCQSGSTGCWRLSMPDAVIASRGRDKVQIASEHKFARLVHRATKSRAQQQGHQVWSKAEEHCERISATQD